ncbi:MAG: glycosyltransferase family 2 protein [Ruminococcus sp.]|nr:glycosyltransferase family 2 protein [Ruminococcus sp.]
MKTIYLVIPCYNEEAVLPETTKRLTELMSDLRQQGMITPQSRIVLVNDGSKDRTWEMIEEYYRTQPQFFEGICLSRNQGHQNALLAGMMTVKDRCDAVISLDADLQDDINAIREMIAKFEEGFDVVYGVRSARKTDSAFKRMTAQGFYKLMHLMGAEVVYNHADYRLMSRRALEGLAEYREVNLFLRGIVPMIGYPSTTVYYERAKRFAGESKYPLKKMLGFAMQGITSLSVKPIRMITSLGVTIFLVSMAMIIYCLIRHFTGYTVAGWTSTAISVWAIGGLQLFAVGVIGEYIGKIYLETKQRPKYFVQTYLSDRKDDNGDFTHR